MLIKNGLFTMTAKMTTYFILYILYGLSYLIKFYYLHIFSFSTDLQKEQLHFQCVRWPDLRVVTGTIIFDVVLGRVFNTIPQMVPDDNDMNEICVYVPEKNLLLYDKTVVIIIVVVIVYLVIVVLIVYIKILPLVVCTVLNHSTMSKPVIIVRGFVTTLVFLIRSAKSSDLMSFVSSINTSVSTTFHACNTTIIDTLN